MLGGGRLAKDEERLEAVSQKELELERDDAADRRDELEQLIGSPDMEVDAVVDVASGA